MVRGRLTAKYLYLPRVRLACSTRSFTKMCSNTTTAQQQQQPVYMLQNQPQQPQPQYVPVAAVQQQQQEQQEPMYVSQVPQKQV